MLGLLLSLPVRSPLPIVIWQLLPNALLVCLGTPPFVSVLHGLVYYPFDWVDEAPANELEPALLALLDSKPPDVC